MAKSRYKKYLPRTLQEAYIQSIADPDKLDMSDELSLLRTVLSKYVERIFDEEQEIDEKTIKSLTTLVDKIAKVQSSISDHEYRNKEHIHINSLPLIIQAITKVIRGVVQDERLIAMISEGISQLQLTHKTVDMEVVDGEE